MGKMFEYPGAGLIATLRYRGIPFCMRSDSSSSFKAVTAFMRFRINEQVVTLPSPNTQDAIDCEYPRQQSTVRLIRQVARISKSKVHLAKKSGADMYNSSAEHSPGKAQKNDCQLLRSTS